MDQCEECGHLRIEHCEDGLCDLCDCPRFTRIALWNMPPDPFASEYYLG